MLPSVYYFELGCRLHKIYEDKTVPSKWQSLSWWVNDNDGLYCPYGSHWIIYVSVQNEKEYIHVVITTLFSSHLCINIKHNNIVDLYDEASLCAELFTAIDFN